MAFFLRDGASAVPSPRKCPFRAIGVAGGPLTSSNLAPCEMDGPSPFRAIGVAGGSA